MLSVEVYFTILLETKCAQKENLCPVSKTACFPAAISFCHLRQSTAQSGPHTSAHSEAYTAVTQDKAFYFTSKMNAKCPEC